MWDSTVVEKRKTIKYCLIMENLPLLWSQLGHIQWEFLSLLLNLFFLIIFSGLFIIYFFVGSLLLFIQDGKPCNALVEMKMLGTNF